MNRRALPWAVLLALFLPSCAFTAKEGTSDSWREYTASDGSYSVAYPENFEPVEYTGADIDPEGKLFSEDDLAGVVFGNGRPSAVAGVTIGLFGGGWEGTELRLGVTRLSGDIPDIDAFADLVRESNRIHVGYKELHFQDTSIRGLPGYDYSYQTSGTTREGNEVDQAVRMVFLQHEGDLYTVSGGAVLGTFEKEADIIDRFITSFRLL
jgi:hypothetical protein